MSDALLSGAGLSLWFGSLLAIVCTFAFRAIPAITPAWRYRIWFAVLLVCATLPLALAWLGPQPSAVVRRATMAAVAPALAVARPTPVIAAPLSRLSDESSAENAPSEPRHPATLGIGAAALPLLAAIAAGGVLVGLVLLVGQLVRLGRLKRRATPLTEYEIRLGFDIPTDGMRRPRLLSSPDLTQPSACGYFRPAIVLPAALLPRVNDAQLRHLLLHEAAHLRRWDDWALLIERVLLLLCWWHPASWWVRRQLDTTRELACDALVAERTDRRAYARTLVALAEWSLPPARAIAPGALQGVLSQRISALIERPAKTTAGARALSGFMILAAVAVALSNQSPRIYTRATVSDTISAIHRHTGFARGAAATGLDSLFTRFEREGFSGTVLVAQGDAVLLDKGYGLADREAMLAMTRTTRFSAAGMTKMFTAAAILVLEDEGRLRVTDSLGRWFPGLPPTMAGVTIHQLLLHADGLTRLSAPVYRSDAEAFLQAIAATPASFAPGTAYRYNDFGHSILGVVIERVSGQAYESYIQERFLEPAGMSRTSFEPDGDAIAIEYSGAADALEPIAPRAYTWGRRASLGLVTTTGDLFRWSRAVADPRILPSGAWRKMRTTYGRTDWQSEAGYGWDRMPGRAGRGGLWRRVAGTPGMEGELLYDPISDWTAVILVNTRLGWRFKVWRAIESAD